MKFKGNNKSQLKPFATVLILDKVENGELDIVPDEMGLEMYNTWKESPSKLADMFSNMYHEA